MDKSQTDGFFLISQYIIAVHGIIGCGVRLIAIIIFPPSKLKYKNKEQLSGLMIITGLLLSCLVAILYVFRPALIISGQWQTRPFLIPLGAICLIIHLVFFSLSHFHLKNFWSGTLAIKEMHVLVTRGIYRNIRHPMYTGLFFWAIGSIFVGQNAYFFVIFILIAGILLRIFKEEKMLENFFKEEYRAYKKRSRMFF
jgi:protein-S-isoprenylcysteine O-methyltransferase Ste14